MSKLTVDDWSIVLTLADNRMQVATTARKLCYHKNTVTYHINKIKKLTGLDPLNFYDLIKLVKQAKEECHNERFSID